MPEGVRRGARRGPLGETKAALVRGIKAALVRVTTFTVLAALAEVFTTIPAVRHPSYQPCYYSPYRPPPLPDGASQAVGSVLDDERTESGEHPDHYERLSFAATVSATTSEAGVIGASDTPPTSRPTPPAPPPPTPLPPLPRPPLSPPPLPLQPPPEATADGPAATTRGAGGQGAWHSLTQRGLG